MITENMKSMTDIKPTIEICTGGYEDCVSAALGGADRVELNAALSVGGLTPGIAALRRVKRDTALEVICMVRPRAAGFCYSERETELMFEEAELLLAHGADGIAFGFLREDGGIDRENTAKMTELIHQKKRQAVFHRAFDVCRDVDASMEDLISLGVDRVLSSGQQAKATEGKDLLKRLQEAYGKRIQILAGGGVNDENVRELTAYTGIQQVHSSCKDYRKDVTTTKGNVSYSYLPAPYGECYDVVSVEKVKRLVKAVR